MTRTFETTEAPSGARCIALRRWQWRRMSLHQRSTSRDGPVGCFAASEVVDGHADSAATTLDRAIALERRSLAVRPDDADTHALAVWILMAMASANRSRWSELSAELSAHRRRAPDLAPRNPRVMIMDASMTFYSPVGGGSGPERAITKWLEALDVLASERIEDPMAPDWGSALAQGWLANLYLSKQPPDIASARTMVTKALQLRPDFWWVRTQLLSRLER
jgi:hypothetical protein